MHVDTLYLGSKVDCFCAFDYGSNSRGGKQQLWKDLSGLNAQCLPWTLLGFFSVVAYG